MKNVLSVAVAGVVLGSAGASAHVPEAEWAQFKKEYAALVERVNALSVENEQLKAKVAAGMGAVTVEDLASTNAEIDTLKKQNSATGWAETVKWQGDFRYRYEDIDNGGSDRERHRVRARAALIAKPVDNIEVGLGLATGGDDPVSTNQTLGGGGSTKDIKLDLAYAKWQPGPFWLSGGKVKNPYYKPFKSALIWDDDFRPEGLFAGWEGEFFFVNTSYIHIESDSRNNLDKAIWGGQVGGKLGPVTLAAGYLDIPTKGLPAIYDDDFFGNSSVINASGEAVYEFDYKLYTVGADVEFNLGSFPLGFYADFVQNDDADDNDTGYIVGAKLGKAKKRGSWQIQYQWQTLEADATFALVTDSDFMGGGTDGEGHKIGAAYALLDDTTLGFTYFDGDRCFDDIKCDSRDYKRLQVDAKFKY
jgi:hypothetical protein